MKALMGENAKAILDDPAGSEGMRSFLTSHEDETEITLKDGKSYIVRRRNAKAKKRAEVAKGSSKSKPKQ